MFEIPSTDSRGIPFLDKPSEQSSSATGSGTAIGECHAIDRSSISKIRVEPPGMPGWENLP